MENFDSFLVSLLEILSQLTGVVIGPVVVKLVADQENCLPPHVGQDLQRVKKKKGLQLKIGAIVLKCE